MSLFGGNIAVMILLLLIVLFLKVKFPYRCFDELVKKEKLIVALVKSQFVDTDLFLLDKLLVKS